MLAFVVYQLGILDGGEYSTEVREKVGLWFAISCTLNMVWIFLWHYEQIGFSTIVIALLLVTLILINNRLRIVEGNLLQRLAAKAGFSLYYGWIIAATIANISVFLTQIGWNGWGLSADFWTVTVLLIGAVIAGVVAMIGKNRIAAAAVMWAYAGILFRHFSAAYYGGDHPFVIIIGLISELMILMAILMPQIRKVA